MALPPDRPAIPLGLPAADAVLGGGLRRGALHEVFAGDWGAGGFAACLAIQAAGKKPLFWIRPDYEALEYGASLGHRPAGTGRRSRKPVPAARRPMPPMPCPPPPTFWPVPHVGAVVLEISGQPALPGSGGQPQAGVCWRKKAASRLFCCAKARSPSPAPPPPAGRCAALPRSARTMTGAARFSRAADAPSVGALERFSSAMGQRTWTLP